MLILLALVGGAGHPAGGVEAGVEGVAGHVATGSSLQTTHNLYQSCCKGQELFLTVCDQSVAEAFSGITVRLTKLMSSRSVTRVPPTERMVCRALLWLSQ